VVAPLAVVSLGTNTVRLLVARPDESGGLADVELGAIGTRLGEGLRDGGSLGSEPRARTLAAVREFAERARAHGARVVAIATSAMRRAENGAAFALEVEEACGAPLQILGGEREAGCSFRGATARAERDGLRRAVVDIGGGSTECAVGCDGVLEAAASVEIGSVRLTELFPGLAGTMPGAPARAAAASARTFLGEKLAGFAAFRPISEARCVAGTPLTLGAVAFGSSVDRVSGRTLSLGQIEALVERLLDLDLQARKDLPGMLAQRADVLPAGGLILCETLRLLECDAAKLESDDLLLGFLLETFAASEPALPLG
jgi:exopolyphosphatase/guanosine-5'-triphosphate,3'-diphosphate pyrophosphatase